MHACLTAAAVAEASTARLRTAPAAGWAKQVQSNRACLAATKVVAIVSDQDTHSVPLWPSLKASVRGLREESPIKVNHAQERGCRNF